jgi:MoaA/NifB/PqqE/SkfB family radical SAM enzyme
MPMDLALDPPPHGRAQAAATRWLGWLGRQAEIRLGRRYLRSRPATINIELTGRCNVKPACTFCVGKNLPGYKEPGHMDAQLRHYWPHLLKAERVNDCSYGEPLLHPEFDKVVGGLTDAGVKFGFTTNGLLLDARRARFIAERGALVDMCVSLNAATPETYYKHHGKDFARVLANIEGFVAIHEALRPGKKVPLVVSCIVMRQNRHEVPDFLRLADRIGARAALLRHLFDIGAGDFEMDDFGHHFVYEEERLSLAEYQAIEAEVRSAPEFRIDEMARWGTRSPRALEVYFAWSSKDAFIAEQAEPGVDIPCLFPWKFLTIRPLHRSFNPCVYLKKKSLVESPDTPFEEVWNGPVLRELRHSLAAGHVPDFCMKYGDSCPLVLERRAALSPPGDAVAEKA